MSITLFQKVIHLNLGNLININWNLGIKTEQSITIEQAVRPFMKRDKKNQVNVKLYSNPKNNHEKLDKF